MRVYGRMAEEVVGRCPVSIEGRRALDLGSGTGAASRAILAAGGRPVAVDLAPGMVGLLRASGVDALPVVADALDLPFPDRPFGAVVAAFSLNHVTDLPAGLREAVRVTVSGGAVVASGYAESDDHPAKHAVTQALSEWGWMCPAWYAEVQERAAPGLGSVEAAAAAARAAGLSAEVVPVEVSLDDLAPVELVDWRLGMGHTAPFVEGLSPGEQQGLRERALEILGADPPPLRRSIILLRAVV